MYIKQLKTKDFNYPVQLILYLIVTIGFFALMLVNFIATEDMNSEDLIHQMIDQFGSNITFVMMVLPLSMMCFGLLFWVKFIHQQSIRSLITSREKIDWKRFLFSFAVWGIFTTVMTVLVYFASPENFVFNFKPIPFFIFLILAIVLIPLQTSFEELMFRGYLMQGIGIFTNSRLLPFVLTSVLFGLMHLANPEVGKMGYIIMVYYIGTGFFLGMLTLMDEGLELALGFHAVNNLVGALLVTSDWTAFQTNSVLKDIAEPTAGFDVLVPVLIIYPILIYVFARKYQWKDWKNKLFGKVIEATESL